MAKFLLKECSNCHRSYPPENYFPTKSVFFKDGYLSICKDCLEALVRANSGSLEFADKVCRWADYPFLPDQWIKIYNTNKEKAFSIYFNLFSTTGYVDLGWAEIDKKMRALKEEGTLEDSIQLLKDDKLQELRKRWGLTYDEEELIYLEEIYQGFLRSYPIAGNDQIDIAKKLSCISLIVRDKIQSGEKYKDDLDGYASLMKIGNFVAKSVINAADFDSVGELFLYLEKDQGFINRFYDGANKDIVDNTMKNIQAWSRQLYTGESGIGEEIKKRIESLQIAQELESTYDELNAQDQEKELDEYEKDSYNFEEDFVPEIN